MKYLVLSDIHGSFQNLKTVFSNFADTCDFIILCGDYLNHGPRNPLPEGWNTKETAELLNSYKSKIICVRGNCDSEVDQMMLNFPCLNAYTNLVLQNEKNSYRIFIHHGHLYDKNQLEQWLTPKTIVISGHTHITRLETENCLTYFNPGSISLPKCDDGKTCGLLELTPSGLQINLCSIEGKILKSLTV